MRYEVMRLLQFLFSLSLILVAFMGGMFVGWRRWGRRGPEDLTVAEKRPRHDDAAVPPPVADAATYRGAGRRDLFAPEQERVQPEVDLRVASGATRLALPEASG